MTYGELSLTLHIFGPLGSVADREDRFFIDDVEGLIEWNDCRAEGSCRSPSLSPKRPIEDLHEVVASVGAQPCDRMAGVGMEQRIALATPVRPRWGARWK
jgi:hypothetical protein